MLDSEHEKIGPDGCVISVFSSVVGLFEGLELTTRDDFLSTLFRP